MSAYYNAQELQSNGKETAWPVGLEWPAESAKIKNNRMLFLFPFIWPLSPAATGGEGQDEGKRKSKLQAVGAVEIVEFAEIRPHRIVSNKRSPAYAKSSTP